MPRIENWSRQRSEERRTRPYVWKNRKTNDRVEITELAHHTGGGWRIKKVEGGKTGPQRTLKVEDTKDEAREWAVKYMRANTNPGSHGSPSQRRSRANAGR